MGKRSRGTFARRPHDSYQSPPEVVLPLLPHLAGVTTFAEPCRGEGKLIAHLERHKLRCVYSGDIQTGQNALDVGNFGSPDRIITNPPWTRQLLHPLIEHFMCAAPTWLLFDSDWANTLQAAPYLPHCVKIVAIGRVKWFTATVFESKDNAAWYLFDRAHTTGPKFIGRELPISEQQIDPENEVEAA